MVSVMDDFHTSSSTDDARSSEKEEESKLPPPKEKTKQRSVLRFLRRLNTPSEFNHAGGQGDRTLYLQDIICLGSTQCKISTYSPRDKLRWGGRELRAYHFHFEGATTVALVNGSRPLLPSRFFYEPPLTSPAGQT
jgi:hypothetical protein